MSISFTLGVLTGVINKEEKEVKEHVYYSISGWKQWKEKHDYKPWDR